MPSPRARLGQSPTGTAVPHPTARIRHDGNRTAADGICGKIHPGGFQSLQRDEDIAWLHLTRVVREAANVDSWERGKLHGPTASDATATTVRSSLSSHVMPGSIGVPGAGT